MRASSACEGTRMRREERPSWLAWWMVVPVPLRRRLRRTIPVDPSLGQKATEEAQEPSRPQTNPNQPNISSRSQHKPATPEGYVPVTVDEYSISDKGEHSPLWTSSAGVGCVSLVVVERLSPGRSLSALRSEPSPVILILLARTHRVSLRRFDRRRCSSRPSSGRPN